MHKTSRWQQIQLEALINADPTEYTSVPCRCGQRPPPPLPLTLKGAAPARRAKRARHLSPYAALLFFAPGTLRVHLRTQDFSRFTSRSAANSVSMETVRGSSGGAGGGGVVGDDRREEEEVEGAHDVDFLTHSVPWDANCQQVCAFRASVLKCRPCSRLFSHT